jgi:hypothetical protein
MTGAEGRAEVESMVEANADAGGERSGVAVVVAFKAEVDVAGGDEGSVFVKGDGINAGATGLNTCVLIS